MTDPNGNNRKKHLQALSNPETARMHRELQEKWKEESLLQRGDRVIKLLEAGCTARGLAADLGKSPGTILHSKRVAKLPPAERAQVEAGANPKRFLDRAGQAARKARYDERMAEEKEKEKEVDRIFQAIEGFMDEEGYNHSAHRDNLVTEVWRQVGQRLQMNILNPERCPLPPLAPANADPKRIIASCDRKVDCFLPLSYHADQLSEALLRITHDPDILLCAIGKAVDKYESLKRFIIPCGQPHAEDQPSQ